MVQLACLQITLEDFEVLRILGRGGFGEVYACRKIDTGALFAIKCLDKRRLKLKHQESTAVHERNVLAEVAYIILPKGQLTRS